MKNTMIVLAAVAAAVATPAMAGTINAEVRFADVRGGAPDSTEYKVDYSAPLTNLLNYGAEITVKQKENAGSLTSKVAARVGPNLPVVLGFKTQAYGEFGEALTAGDDYVFWGAGVKTSHKLYGPVSINGGYRHRSAFDATHRLNEERLNAGLGANIGHGNAVGVNYYRTTGTTRADAIGVGLTHTF